MIPLSTPARKIALFAVTMAALAGATPGPALAQSDFQSCLQNIRGEAVRQGVPEAVADGALRNLTPDQKVLDLDGRQPEFTLTFARYVGNSVTADRVVRSYSSAVSLFRSS